MDTKTRLQIEKPIILSNCLFEKILSKYSVSELCPFPEYIQTKRIK